MFRNAPLTHIGEAAMSPLDRLRSLTERIEVLERRPSNPSRSALGSSALPETFPGNVASWGRDASPVV